MKPSRAPRHWPTKRIDERFARLPAAQAALEAARIVAARPPTSWEVGVCHIADRPGLPASLIRIAVKDVVKARNRDPRAVAQMPLRHTNAVTARLAQDTDHALEETVNGQRLDGARHVRHTPSRRANLAPRGIEP